MPIEIQPVLFQWHEADQVMVPAKRHLQLCKRQFVDMGTYFLGPHGGPLSESDKAYFASVGNAFKNLNDAQLKKWPSAEYLRKWALCKTGYCDHELRPFALEKDAREAGAMVRKHDAFCVIVVREARDDEKKQSGGDWLVEVFTALSQRRGSMPDEKRKKSMTDVLDFLAREIGITRAELQQHSKTAEA